MPPGSGLNYKSDYKWLTGDDPKLFMKEYRQWAWAALKDPDKAHFEIITAVFGSIGAHSIAKFINKFKKSGDILEDEDSTAFRQLHEHYERLANRYMGIMDRYRKWRGSGVLVRNMPGGVYEILLGMKGDRMRMVVHRAVLVRIVFYTYHVRGFDRRFTDALNP